MEQSFTFAPVGVVHCSNRYKFEAPRQGVYSHGSRAEIELLPGCGFETALCDLDGFARIWVIFVFDRNHVLLNHDFIGCRIVYFYVAGSKIHGIGVVYDTGIMKFFLLTYIAGSPASSSK